MRALPQAALVISRYRLDALLARTFQELGGELLPTVGRLPSKLTNVWAPSGLNTWRIYGQDFFGGLLPDCF